MKTFLVSTLVFFILLGIGLCGLEQYLVHFAPQSGWCPINHEWKIDDPVLPYKPKPGYSGRMIQKGEFDVKLTIDKDGYRITPKGKGKKVVFIGDSFLFGWGVNDEETLPYIFAEKTGCRVTNAACYGYDIRQYREVFNRILPLKPDMIIVGFYVGNDFDQTPLKTDPAPNYVSEHKENKLKNWINNLQIVVGIRERLYQNYPNTRAWLMKCGVISRSDIYLKEYPEYLKENVRKTRQILAEMDAICKKKKIRFEVLALPTREMVYWSDVINSKEGYDALRPLHQLWKYDYTPTFVSKERLYFDTDPHWTLTGHRYFAEKLVEYLELK